MTTAIPVLPTNYRRIALAAIERAVAPLVSMDGKRVTDLSEAGPITQKGIRGCRNFEVRDGTAPILGFHDHPNEMWVAARYRELAEHCAAEGWLRIQGPVAGGSTADVALARRVPPDAHRVRPAVVIHVVAGLLATVLACVTWIGGNDAAHDAVARDGSNIDAGAIEVVVALYVLAPAAVLFWAASLALWQRLRWAFVLHWAAVLVELFLLLGVALPTFVGILERTR